MRASLALLIMIPLAACSAAQQCRLDVTRTTRILDRQIADTQAAVTDGYRLVPVPNPFHVGLQICAPNPFRPGRDCDEEDDPILRRERVNVPAERAKLASLIAQRKQAEAPTQAALAACPPGP